MKKIILIMIALAGSQLIYAQLCNLQISGHVHSSRSHINLPKATIILEATGQMLITDDNGDFVFKNLCAAEYNIIVSHTSYDTMVRTINLRANTHIDLDLVTSKTILEEIKLTGERMNGNTGMRSGISGKELDDTRGKSLGEALDKINGVSLLKTGSNVSKPVIHGLHSNRILTINNGVRQEGQQWGNEHAPDIDPFIANRLTVIKGVDELRYGSDAIGGVILVEPASLRTLPGYNAKLNTIYFSNNRQYVVSGVWEQQFKELPSLTYRLQATFKKGANVSTPGYRLNNTASEEKNVSATVALRREHFQSELFYSYFNNKVGIFTGSHIGNLTDLLKAIDSDKPGETFTGQDSYKINRPYQAVAHHLVKSKSVLQSGAHKFNFLVAAQLNSRKEYDIVRSSNNKRPQMDLDILTVSEDINWEHPRRNNISGTIGIAGMQQDNSYAGRYFIPNYKSNTYGGYIIEKWSKNDWEAQAGLRFDHKKINTSRMLVDGTTFDQFDFKYNTLATSFNAGYRVMDGLRINSNISLSGRAPHVNELLSNGIHHGTATFETGDPNLEVERSLNVSLNGSYQNMSKTVVVDVTLYNNRIHNFIYQQPYPDEPVLTIAGAFPKIVYEQADASLQGLDISAVVKPIKQLEWQGKFSMLRARNTEANDWLILMPSDNISNELIWHFKESKKISNTYLSAGIKNVFKQTRVPAENNGKRDYKGAPAAYTLVNAHFSTSFKAGSFPVTAQLSATNLLNKVYRHYVNSHRYFTDEMGRNISLRLQFELQHFYN